jgi:hypothetical protein
VEQVRTSEDQAVISVSGRGEKLAYRANKAVKDRKLRAGDSKLTLRIWLNTWLAERAPQDASERVDALYRQSADTHLIPAIGHMKVADLRRADCNALVSALFKGARAARTLSARESCRQSVGRTARTPSSRCDSIAKSGRGSGNSPLPRPTLCRSSR